MGVPLRYLDNGLVRNHSLGTWEEREEKGSLQGFDGKLRGAETLIATDRNMVQRSDQVAACKL